MRAILALISQAMTTQAQPTTVQAQDLKAQANQDVAPRLHQQVTTMASHLRDFTWMNPPIFYESKVDEDPQKFLDEVYKVLYAMGVTLSDKAKLTSYQLKDEAQTWYVQWEDIGR